MKNILYLSLFIIIFFPVVSCKSKKSATVSTSNITQEQNTTDQTYPAISPSTNDSFRLVVSFYSIGEGIDYKVKEEFEKFLNSYSKKIVYEPTSWGREGETDYCLKLNELAATGQADFVKKVKELLSKSKLVYMNENTKCVHKN